MKMWLDDVRPMPYDYDIHVKSAPAAIALLATGLITHVSLDHDLGDVYHDGSPTGTGVQVADWIEKAAHDCTLSRLVWSVHSANPPGAERITAALKSADRYWHARECQEKTQ